jgi:hypothetical protein
VGRRGLGLLVGRRGLGLLVGRRLGFILMPASPLQIP